MLENLLSSREKRREKPGSTGTMSPHLAGSTGIKRIMEVLIKIKFSTHSNFYDAIYCYKFIFKIFNIFMLDTRVYQLAFALK